MGFSGISQSSSNSVPVALAVGAIAATTLWWQFSRENKKPLHVDYTKPNFPLFIRIIAAFPSSMRRSMVLQGASPKLPMDSLDFDSTSSPILEKKELVPGKLWRVRYQFVKNLEIVSMSKLLFGMDMLDEEGILSKASDAEKEQLKQAMSKLTALMGDCKDEKDPKAKAKKCFEAGFLESQDMIVVKVKDNSLMLYNPCRMHDEVVQYLQTIGSVDYIVSGASAHTNQVPQAAAKFPSAKVVCSHVANLKCQFAGMRSADHVYTDSDALQALNTQLGKDVQLFHVQGDTFTQNLLVRAHGHLLETDLACYGNGKRHFNVPESVWTNADENSLQVGAARLLYYSSAAEGTVARGYLPDFRVLGCDPTSVFHALTLEGPKPDGSSCLEMAACLRKLLTLGDYQFVDNVHSIHGESVPAEEFKEVVNGSWSWLDGKSLLQ